MICHMAWGGNSFKCPVCTIDNVAIGHNMVGFKGVICVFFEARPFKSFRLGRRAPVNGGVCACLQWGAGRRMVKMSMRDQNMTDTLIGFQRVQNRLDMLVQQRARINYSDIAVADYICAGAGESEGTRIIRNDAANAR